jgi:hypothetical protein
MVGGLHPVQAETKADPYGMTTKEQATARQKQIPTG